MDWIATIVVGLFSLVGVYFSNRKSATLMQYKIDQLQVAVERHNKVIERTYKLEERASVLETEVEDLRKKVS